MANKNPTGGRFNTFSEKLVAAASTGKEVQFYPEDEVSNTGPVFEFTPEGLRAFLIYAGLDGADIPAGIQALLDQKADLESPTFTGNVSGLSINLDDFNVGVINTDGTLSANSDNVLATQKAVKTYVDANIGGGGGTGDVTGPGSSVDNNIAIFDGTTGKIIQDSGYAASDFATAAQGTLADTAVQPADIGTAAAEDVGYFATAAQGSLADSALQSVVAGTNVSIDNTDPQNPVISATGGSGGGDVSGPASSIDNRIAQFNGTTGKILEDSGALITDFATAAQGTLADAAIAGAGTVTSGNPVVFSGTTGKAVSQVTFSSFKTSLSLVKGDVGLGNVDNTSDAGKPVSTATQTALDLKAPLASPTFTGTVSGITKSMVGLGNVDNTSDASKPVSTATQTALDLKAPLASPIFTGTASFPNTGLRIADTNATHYLIVAPGSNITANRTLTLTTGDANRTLDISAGSVTIGAGGITVVAATSIGAGLAVVSNKLIHYESIQIAVSDETTNITTGTAKVTFRMPYAFTLTDVRASLSTAQTAGSIFTVDVNEGGTTILSTKLTIDNNEKTSTTAATARVISDTSLADDAEITIDVDQVGTAGAKGLKVTLIGYRP